MLENKYKQLTISEHISLYDKIIPKDHILRKLKENVDFSFVNKLVAKEYCEELGRPAKEPEKMFKLLFLQIKDLLSDREVIDRAKTDMAYKYFLDINPEDDVPCYSLLSIFRNTKIKEEAILEEMLQETVKQAIEKGVVKSNSIIVDAAHTQSKAVKRTPTQVLRELSKELRKEIYRTNPEMKDKFPTKPSDEDTLEAEIEYTNKLIAVIKNEITDETSKKITNKVKHIDELLKSDKIKEIQSAYDKDAKQGYKSETNSFFGYKNHIAMTEDRIITGLEVTTGEAPDGKYMKKLVEKSQKSGIDVKEVIGDRAYSGRENLDYGKEEGIKIIARLNPVISNSQKMKDGFEYIKDADTLRCPAGNLAKRKQYRLECIKKDGGKRNATMEYTFDIKKCETCSQREKCELNKSKHKTYMISIPSNTHKEQQEFENTEYFKNKMRYERYKIEAKNGEIKQAHGLCKAKYMGLSRVRIQSYITCIVANIKRIIKLSEQVMG